MTHGPDWNESESVELPIDGTLDLHPFSPKDVRDVVDEYLRECVVRRILAVRIIHGKGVGNLRRTVHAALRRNPAVAAYRQAGEDGGGWGATLVTLHPAGEPGGTEKPEDEA